MTTYGSDTFTRPDQSGFGTASDGQTWANVGGPGTASITSNRGLLGIANGYTIMRLGTGQHADVELTTVLNQGGSNFNSTGIVWRVADIDNNYRAVMYDGQIWLQYFSGGAKNTITTSASISGFTNSADWNMKVRNIGTSIKVRVWQGTEPSSWDIDTTDSHITAAGYYGLESDLSGGAGSGSSKYYNFTVTDGNTTTTSTRTVTADAALLQTSTRTISDTAALLATSTRTIPATAALLITNTRTISDDAALLATSTRTIPISAALELTSSRTIGASAALELTLTRTIPASTALIATQARTIPATAALIGTLTRSIPTDAALELTSSRTIPATAALELTGSRTVGASAALLATLRRTIPCTTVLSGISVAPPTNVTFYVRGGGATFYARSGQATFYIRK